MMTELTAPIASKILTTDLAESSAAGGCREREGFSAKILNLESWKP